MNQTDKHQRTLSTREKATHGREKVFANHISEKGSSPENTKISYNSTTTKQTAPLKNGQQT